MAIELKKGQKIYIGIDRSGSMSTRDCNGLTRYEDLEEKTSGFLSSAINLNGGVELFIFNHKVEHYSNVTSADQVKSLMRSHPPGGNTNTHLLINQAWKQHQ